MAEKYDNSEVYMYETCPSLGSCKATGIITLPAVVFRLHDHNWWLVLSNFINLTQVHNFTVSAQDIFTFRRLSVFTVSFTGILQLLMQIIKPFEPSYWLVKWLWNRVYNQKVVSSSPSVCVFVVVVFFTLIDSFDFIYYRCTTTSEEWNFGSFYFKRLMRNA